MSAPLPPSLLLPAWSCQKATSCAHRAFASAPAGSCATAAPAETNSMRVTIATVGPCIRLGGGRRPFATAIVIADGQPLGSRRQVGADLDPVAAGIDVGRDTRQ